MTDEHKPNLGTYLDILRASKDGVSITLTVEEATDVWAIHDDLTKRLRELERWSAEAVHFANNVQTELNQLNRWSHLL